MKKFLTFLITLIIFIPLVYAKNDVTITNVELLEKSESAEIISEPTYEGLNTIFNVKFVSVEDYVLYEITIKNTDTKEYEINLSNTTNDHIEYDYECENGNIIKPNEEKSIIARITYINEVDPSALENGAYVENKEFVISLSGEENPYTGSINYAVILMVLIIVFAIIYHKLSAKQTNFTFGIILILLLVPIATYALVKITLTIKSSVTISDDIHIYVIGPCPTLGANTSTGNKIPNNDTYEEIENSSSCKYTYNAKVGMSFIEASNTYSFRYDARNYMEEGMTLSNDKYGIDISQNDTILINNHTYYILKLNNFNITSPNGLTTYDYVEGMTFNEWLESPLNIDNLIIEDYKNYSCDKDKTYLFKAGDHGYIYIFLDDLINQVDYNLLITDLEFENTCQYRTFTMDDKEYRYVAGMYFGDWFRSKYNIDDRKIIENNKKLALVSSSVCVEDEKGIEDGIYKHMNTCQSGK